MKEIIFRRLGVEDAPRLSELLSAGPSDYSRYFHPFSFSCEAISQVIAAASSDLFFGLEVCESQSAALAGFYMLRGFDEGYADPMYGVFIGYSFRGRGLAKLTLFHAETFCRLNGIEHLLLKVHPDNKKARKLYETQHFTFLRIDPENKNIVLQKKLPQAP